jgi:rare lipoprotein A
MNKYSIIFLLLSLLLVSADKREQPYNEIGYTQEGSASYYADKFHGRKTASGEAYNMNDMTAAHPRIKFNTKIKVTNLNNDKSVIVRINDRGPYTGGRIIDLSKAAAEKLNMIRSGVIPVKTEVVDKEEFVIVKEDETKENPTIELEKSKRKTKKKAEEEVKQTKVGRLLDRVFKGKKKQETKQQEKPQNPKKSEQKTESEPQQSSDKDRETKPKEANQEVKISTNKPKGGTIDKPQPVKNKSNEEKFSGVNTYSLWGTIKYPNGFGVQIGSYTVLEKALEKGKAIYGKGFQDIFIQTGWAGKNRIFRILVGEGSSETVTALIPKLREAGYSGGFVKQHY